MLKYLGKVPQNCTSVPYVSKWNTAIIINKTCAFPVVTCQKLCSEKEMKKRPLSLETFSHFTVGCKCF